MKKLVALLLALLMIFAIVACTGTTPAQTETKTETKTEAKTETKTETKTEAKTETKAEEPKAETKAEEPAKPAYEGPDTYKQLENFDVTTLDYVYNNKSSNGDYLSNFIEGLLTQDPHGTLVAGMAKEWSPNEDASEWTFIIRDDAVWATASGEEYDKVVAEDFVTGLKHLVDSKSETLGLVLDLIKGLRAYTEGTGSWEDVGIKADGNKLVYTLTQGCAYFDGMTTYSCLWPINAEFLESKGEKFGAVEPDGILYNGCYILSSLVASQEIRFDANPLYYDKENVFVQHVVVTFTDGKDPAQNFNMFVNGEVTETAINSSLPDVVAKADELFADNQYISMTDSTTFWGQFNVNRGSYTLYNDPSVSSTQKTTDAQKADTKAAIKNANFRRAVYAAFSAHAVNAITEGEERADDAIRNTLVPFTFVTTSDGRSYGNILTGYLVELAPELAGIDLTDGHDAWYNPELAKQYAAKAKEELGDTISEWPVHLDIPVNASSENNKNIQLATQKAIEDAIGEYVKIDLNYYDNVKAYRSTYYSLPDGPSNGNDVAFNAGWGPDYGDPQTYLHCVDIKDGDMLNYMGVSTVIQGQTEEEAAVLKEIGLDAIQEVLEKAYKAVGDERIEYFAKAEAMLLANGFLRPFETSGATLRVSKVVPFTAAYGLYGQASWNHVQYFKYMKLVDEPITKAQYEAAKAAWLAGE